MLLLNCVAKLFYHISTLMSRFYITYNLTRKPSHCGRVNFLTNFSPIHNIVTERQKPLDAFRKGERLSE